MTPAERKAVAETLRTWAAWCEASNWNTWCGYNGTRSARAWALAYLCCHQSHEPELQGPTAATGLLLAAAMVESGDSA
jgi:hypothetical protein